MCLLTYLPPNTQPIVAELANGATLNDDGHGWAIVAGSTILVGKGFDADEVIAEFASMRQRYPEGPALFHSRMATDGTLDLDNVHPFYVDGDKRTVLAHNGILPLRPGKGEPRSDTRLLADSMGGRFGSLRKPGTRARVTEWMGNFNKLVILSVNRRFPQSAYILNEAAGEWTPDGIWYSNEGYQGFRYVYSGATYSSGYYRWKDGSYLETYPTVVGGKSASTEDTEDGYEKWWKDLPSCRFCMSIMSHVEQELGYCENCDTCQDCDQTSKICQCYVPLSTGSKKYASTSKELALYEGP